MKEQWKSYIEVFAGTAEKYAQRTAIICGERRVSYAQLSGASDVIARALLERSVQKGQIVPIVLPRGPEAFAAMIGVWKTGAAGSWVNNLFPAERIQDICRQCGGGLVIDEAWIKGVDPFAQTARFTPVPVEREDLAMVVFTSGSAGSPKGVLLPHRAVINRAAGCVEAWIGGGCIAEKDIFLSIVPLSSVIIINNEMAFLAMGGLIDIVPDVVKQDMAQLIRYGIEHKFTCVFIPPVLGPLFLKHFEGQLRILNIGSERVSNIFNDKMTIVTGYGCSETAGALFNFYIDRSHENTPIGKPHDGVNAYVLDSDGRLVAEGETGELCMSGECIAQGYLNLEELSAEKFTPNPFCDDPDHRVLYHSGDLVRLNAEGYYEYIQRADWMIKVAGNRVEPGEIEKAIYKAAPVTKAVVVGFESKAGQVSQTRLYACFTANEKLDTKKIQEDLSRVLPVYMIPAFIEQVQSLPLNFNGKIDRSKIVPPEIEYYKSDYEEPVNETEKIIAQKFQEVLGIPRVGALDNFVLLGGDSLSAAKLAFVLFKSTGLSVVDILLHQTPRALAEASAAKSKEETSVPVFEIKETGSVSEIELSPYQVTFYNEWLLNPNRYDYNIVVDKILDGEISVERLNSALVRLFNDYVLFNSNAAADGDRLYWKSRETLSNASPMVQFFDKPLGDEQIFALLSKPFDLKNDPLYRIFLIKLSDTQYRHVSSLHHLLIDGTKAAALHDEYARYYNDPHYSCAANREKQKSLCNGLARSMQALINENREQISAFWSGYCRNVNPVDLKFLQGSKRDNNISPISSCRFSIDRKEMDRIKIISQKFFATAYIFAEAVFALLLHRMSGQNRVSFSYPAAISEGDALFYGSQINTLFINFSFDKDTTAADLIKQAKDHFLAVESNKAKYLPVGEIAGYLPNKEVLRVAFAQTNLREVPYAFEGVVSETTDDRFNFDNNSTLLVLLEEKKEQLDFRFRFNNRILDADLVQKFTDRYQRLLTEIVSDMLAE